MKLLVSFAATEGHEHYVETAGQASRIRFFFFPTEPLLSPSLYEHAGRCICFQVYVYSMMA